MTLTIQLLGVPLVERGGADVPPVRGHKVWGLLAYLMLADGPSTRRHLAEMLFPEADDPVGALRWNLSQLRRLLGAEVALGGDPVTLALPSAAQVDVRVATAGSWAAALRLPGLGRELLEGMSFATTPVFELWLATERRHLVGAAAAVLREAALHCLARGDATAAADHAARLVALDQFDENAHVLLVRSLRAAGARAAADRQVATCTELFRRELGVAPSRALRMAAAAPAAGESPAPAVGRAAIRAQLDAGDAAIRAGALEAGLGALRRATSGARAADEPDLLTRALVALGSALVHAARGSDEEGAAALHEASALAEQRGERASGVLAYRELGYVDLLRGRYERALAQLSRAAELAGDDEPQLAWLDIVTGAVHTDTADYPAALDALERGIARAGAAGDRHGSAYGAAFLGRARLLRGEVDDARRWLEEAVGIAGAEGWVAFMPWPEALLGDVELHAGHIDQATGLFQHAVALGEELDDACWESIGTRGLGLVATARNQVEPAAALLDDAPRRCRRLPDSYLWIEAYALEALCGFAVAHAPLGASARIEPLERIAGRSGMRELLVRSALHRSRLGQHDALLAVAPMARSIDNPWLQQTLAAALPRPRPARIGRRPQPDAVR